MTLRYLLDTCVVSEFVKPQPDPHVVVWMNQVDVVQTYLSVVTIGEVQSGISAKPPSNRRTLLEIWLRNDLLIQFAGRIVSLDVDILLVSGELTASLRSRGVTMGGMDALIAATARYRDMVLVTRNTDDFAHTGLRLLDPWQARDERRD